MIGTKVLTCLYQFSIIPLDIFSSLHILSDCLASVQLNWRKNCRSKEKKKQKNFVKLFSMLKQNVERTGQSNVCLVLIFIALLTPFTKKFTTKN